MLMLLCCVPSPCSDAGEGKWGTDESEFNRIMCTTGRAQLHAIAEEYKKISSYTLDRAIEKEVCTAGL